MAKSLTPRPPKHIHKLKRHKYSNGEEVYFCMLPRCRFKVITAMALGEESICHRCDKPFIMNEITIRLSKPHCSLCTVRKGNKEDITPILDVAVSTILPERRRSTLIQEGDHVSDLRSRLSRVKGQDTVLPDSTLSSSEGLPPDEDMV